MENTQDLNDNDGDDKIGLKQLDSPKHGASSLACEHIQDGDIFLAIPRSVAMLIVLLEVVSNDTLVRESSKIVSKDTSTHVSSLSLLLFVSTATFSSMLNNGVLILSIMACF